MTLRIRIQKSEKNWLRFLFILILSLWTSGPVFGGISGKLYGTVTDEKTGDALIGVNIMILGTRQGTASETDGSYQIQNIRAGMYSVQIRMIGYQTVTFKDIRIHPDRKTRLDISMKEKPLEMEGVEITVEKPLIQTDITGTTYDIEARELVQLPIDQFQDAVGLQPGATYDGHIRGGKKREIFYLIDGLPAQDWIQGGSGLNLPQSAIEQISIQTGGMTAEYGNTLSGVVNVVTATGHDVPSVIIRADKDDLFGGTQVSHANEAEIALSGPIKKEKIYYFTAYQGLWTQTRWWQDMNRFFTSPFRQNANGIAKIDWLLPAGRLSMQCIYSLQRWRDYEFSWRFNLDGLPPRKQISLRPAIIWTHTLSKKTFYTFILGYHDLISKIGSGSMESFAPEPYAYDFYLQYIMSGKRSWWTETHQQVGMLQTHLTSQVHPYHLLKIGAQFNLTRVHSILRKMEPQMTYFGKPLVHEPLLNYSTEFDYTPRSGSVYIQDKFEAGSDRSVVQIGLRFDFLDPRAQRPAVELIPTEPGSYQEVVTEWVPAKVQTHLSPRIGFTMPLSDRSFFFVNYGHYFQYPLFEYLYSGLDNVQLRNGVNVLRGNPDLLAEQTEAWEISTRVQLVENLVGSITYFRKETMNQIDTKTYVGSNSRIAGDYGFAEFVNNPLGESQGVELVLKRDKGNFITGEISYTYMEAKGLSETENQGINYAQWGFPISTHMYYLSWDQRHTLKCDLGFKLPYGFHGNIVFQKTSGRPYTYFPSKDGFTPDLPEAHFLPNNRRMKGHTFFNMKIQKDFQLKKAFIGDPSQVTVYFDGRNLLNNKNVIWMDSSGRIGGELGDPAAYEIGRRMSFGVQLTY